MPLTFTCRTEFAHGQSLRRCLNKFPIRITEILDWTWPQYPVPRLLLSDTPTLW